METKEKSVNMGIENVACTPENDILGDFYEGLMDGIIPQLELTITAVLQNLSDNTVTQSQVQTKTYIVKGSRIGKGVTLDIESLI
jgi:hypothetical protein